MSGFGETLFGGSPFVRWMLSPFVICFALAMPWLIPNWTPAGVMAMIFIESMCIALLAGFWLPARFGRWAYRALAGSVFFLYGACLIYELFVNPKPVKFGGPGRRSQFESLCGFIIIGLPCLWYLLLGRFSLTEPMHIDDCEPPDDENVPGE